MKKIIWIMTLLLTVCTFTVWSYAASAMSSGRHLYIPIIYLLTWAGLMFLGVRMKMRTPFIVSLVYWSVVVLISAAALVASSGITKTFLYKYLTFPTALAIMPFFGLLKSSTENITVFCISLILVSFGFAAFCAFFIAHLCKIKLRVVFMILFPVALTLIGILGSLASFAEAFISYVNGGAQIGAGKTFLIFSILYVFGWICIMVLAVYQEASNLLLGAFVFWCATFTVSIWFAGFYKSAVIPAAFLLSPLYGFCQGGAFPQKYGVVCIILSAVMAALFFLVFRMTVTKKEGYINRH